MPTRTSAPARYALASFASADVNAVQPEPDIVQDRQMSERKQRRNPGTSVPIAAAFRRPGWTGRTRDLPVIEARGPAPAQLARFPGAMREQGCPFPDPDGPSRHGRPRLFSPRFRPTASPAAAMFSAGVTELGVVDSCTLPSNASRATKWFHPCRPARVGRSYLLSHLGLDPCCQSCACPEEDPEHAGLVLCLHPSVSKRPSSFEVHLG